MNNFLSNIQEQFLELKNLHPGNTELQEIRQHALNLFVEKGLPHKKLAALTCKTARKKWSTCWRKGIQG